MSATPERILILKPSSLGDIVHTLPAVAALRNHWSSSEIAWLINPEWAPLLEGNPNIDRVIPFPRKSFRGLTGWTRVPAWLRSLRNFQPDLAVDFQGLLRTALIAKGLGSKTIAGLSDAREGAGWFYQQTVRLPREPIHSVERYLRLAEELTGTPVGKPVFHLPAGTPPAELIPTRFILLHPFSRGQGKSLDVATVTEFSRNFQSSCIVIVGGIQPLENAPSNVINLLGKTTLAELIWLIRHADFTISVDSGPMHIAAAITGKLLSIHTWSDPRLVGPFNPAAWVWKDATFSQMAGYRSHSTENHRPPTAAELAEFVRRIQPINSP